jgi:hypothetical protein
MYIRWIIAAVVVLVLSGGVYFAWRTSVEAGVGAAAMAKVVCSCVFVDGRSLESCRADDPPGFEGIPVTIDKTAMTATGALFGVVRRRAKYSPDYGCTLQP